jgi:FRG domain/Phage integrase, N-terminal SAM-like domain
VIQRLSHFYGWVRQTPELASLRNNLDFFHAVAQHYGLPTTLLDFTFDPEVAGFFASHGARAAPLPGALRFSCIICANSERLTRSWEDINQRHREGTGLVRMVTVDVRNLWRLQAQKGLFLDIHVDANLLEMFSLFLHIEFPWKTDRKVDFAKHFNAPPELGPEHIREYQMLPIQQKKLSWSPFNQAVCAQRFLYNDVLHRNWMIDHIRIHVTNGG